MSAADSWRRFATEKEFSCPACDSELLVRFRNVWALSAVVVVAAVLVAYVAGLRGLEVLALAAIALRSAFFLIIQLSVRLFPPDVKLCCDFRRILYSRDAEDAPGSHERVVLGTPTTDPGPADA